MLPTTHNLLATTSDQITTCKAILHDLKFTTPPYDSAAEPSTYEVLATHNILTAQQTQACYTNTHWCPTTFTVGQDVLLSTKGLELPQFTSRGCHALSNRFIGPYHIIPNPKPTPDSFKLQLPGHLTVHPVFHASLLRPYHAPSRFPLHPRTPVVSDFPLPIGAILGRRYFHGNLQYLAQFADGLSSWVPNQ
jgi:hypothetical protein